MIPFRINLRLFLIVQTEILTTRFAVWVKVRFLTQAHCALPGSWTLTLVVERRGMVHTSVVPYSKIVLILPPMTDVEIVVLDNQLHKPIQRMLALFFGQAIDLLDVVTDSKD